MVMEPLVMEPKHLYFKLTPELRNELKRPLGVLIKGSPPLTYERLKRELEELGKAPLVITVGDVVTENVLRLGIKPDLAIYDERTKRTSHGFRPKTTGGKPTIVEVKNPPGTVTIQLIDAVRRALRFKTPSYIKVIGEEDLAAIPAVIHAPTGSVVLYGQPGEGVVLIKVTPECKRRCARILANMEVVQDGS